MKHLMIFPTFRKTSGRAALLWVRLCITAIEGQSILHPAARFKQRDRPGQLDGSPDPTKSFRFCFIILSEINFQNIRFCRIKKKTSQSPIWMLFGWSASLTWSKLFSSPSVKIIKSWCWLNGDYFRTTIKSIFSTWSYLILGWPNATSLALFLTPNHIYIVKGWISPLAWGRNGDCIFFKFICTVPNAIAGMNKNLHKQINIQFCLQQKH